jgi:hypothetical protein
MCDFGGLFNKPGKFFCDYNKLWLIVNLVRKFGGRPKKLGDIRSRPWNLKQMPPGFFGRLRAINLNPAPASSLQVDICMVANLRQR